MSNADSRDGNEFPKVPKVPLDIQRVQRSRFGSSKAFRDFFQFSKEHSDEFWGQIASEFEWIRPWDTVRKGDLPSFEYFSGGVMNPCVNLLDRHVRSGAGNRVALIWEGEDGSSTFLTYRMLLAEVGKFANVLKSLGVGRGDAVAIFLPNVAECLIAILACYRLGAIYNTIFSGFSAVALKERLIHFCPKVILTADFSIRRGKRIPLKGKVDECLQNMESECKVVVVQRTGDSIAMKPDRDLWWHEAMAAVPIECPAEPLEANEPGLVFYTSGTSGKPKGVVHSGAAFVINNYIFCKYQMDHRPQDVLWCTADVGWLTMHIWGIAGALSNGATTIFAEGALDTPQPDRFFRILDKYRVNKVFTSPSAVRMLMRCGDEWRRRYDVSALEVVGLVGEPLNPEAWEWLYSTLGSRQIYVNNTWGQTELAGTPLAGAAWLTEMKPGSCGEEFIASSLDVVDEDGKSVPAGVPGSLVIRKPFPMMVRTLWKDHERYLNDYFRKLPGCYYTYDAAVRDEDGHFWVLGRLDDVINVAGHRLSTMEIENAILSCDEISEAAVIGCPDPVKGMAPAAFVRLKLDGPAPCQLKGMILNAVEMQIGKIAIPQHIYILDAMPKTVSGKIMRRLLRDIVSSGKVQGDISGIEDSSTVEAVRSAVGHEL